MQKGAIRMRALALDVREEVAPHLSAASDADDGADGERRTRPQRQRARHATAHPIAIDVVIGEWILEREERIPDDDRRAAPGAGDDCHRRVEIQQRDLAQRNFSAEHAQGQLLLDVVGSVAKDSAPDCLDTSIAILQGECDASTRELLGSARGARIRGEGLEARRGSDAHVSRCDRGLVGEGESECLTRNGKR